VSPVRTLIVGLIFVLATAPPARAQDGGWSNTAEFSYVVAAGNAKTATLGFSNKLVRDWERTAFELRLSGIRSESTTLSRRVTASGTPPVVVTDSETQLTAERYGIGARVNRQISDAFFFYGGAEWKRNRFAGIDNQYIVAGGIGNTWFDREGLKFRTEYAATYTSQEDLLAETETFAGARLSWEYQNQLTENTTYTNELVLDQNLDETKDFRADMVNSLQVAMSSSLALKVGLQLLYDNRPSFVAAEDPGGLLTPGQTALVELDNLDTIFTVSLVVNF
jgi:putative salt-induced outer membrane protein YdiY